MVGTAYRTGAPGAAGAKGNPTGEATDRRSEGERAPDLLARALADAREQVETFFKELGVASQLHLERMRLTTTELMFRAAGAIGALTVAIVAAILGMLYVASGLAQLLAAQLAAPWLARLLTGLFLLALLALGFRAGLRAVRRRALSKLRDKYGNERPEPAPNRGPHHA